MADDKKQQLEQQLWKIADTLRGKWMPMILGITYWALSFTNT